MLEMGPYTTGAEGFIPDDHARPDEIDGLFHVTVALDRVLETGLRSRRQLGGMTQGLGGGYDNQAPDRVSVTWSSAKADEIERTLRLAVYAARDLIPSSEIFNETARRYGTDWIGDHVRRTLQTLGAPEEILCQEWPEGIDDWLDAHVAGGGAKYEFLQQIDDAFEREFDRTDDLPARVGLTAPFEAITLIDPNQIATLRLAARPGADVETVPEEMELRFLPQDLVIDNVLSSRLDINEPPQQADQELEPAGMTL